MLRLLPIGFSLCFPALASAVTLWSGPSITWAQPASDASDPANWDRLTDAVAITRGFQEGLYNPLAEDGYVFQVSPAGTEWAFTLNTPASRPPRSPPRTSRASTSSPGRSRWGARRPNRWASRVCCT